MANVALEYNAGTIALVDMFLLRNTLYYQGQANIVIFFKLNQFKQT